MNKPNVVIAASFRKMTAKAILSIALFICAYLLLFGLATALTLACCYLGAMMIIRKPGFYTLLLGTGLVSMGILVLVFLGKFLFKAYKNDRSHLQAITAEEAPELFRMIAALVAEVKTTFPKKVYLSADVNASVFYDSTFWSMIVPAKKNLTIGMGLVNSLTVSEMKAVLAHEFGHFSQRSMKVGGYVYHVNQVIYNMLFENEGYEAFAGTLARLHGAIAFFVNIAVKIVNGIQWLLRKLYVLVNMHYMGLSREMEFHADKVAASVTGSIPLINALLRLQMADQCFQNVLDYYTRKIKASVKTLNIYPQQRFVMKFKGDESRLSFHNDLPQVTLEFLNRYNKSKLVIADRWASHPGTEERIAELRQIDSVPFPEDDRDACVLFARKEKLQRELTSKLFAAVEYPAAPVNDESQQFFKDFIHEARKNAFNNIFNNYYNTKNPPASDLFTGGDFDEETCLHDLFGDESVDLVYIAAALQSDLEILKQLNTGEQKIKRFSYDGSIYDAKDCTALIANLETELDAIQKRIQDNDANIYAYFLSLAAFQDKETEYRSRYADYFATARAYNTRLEQYTNLVDLTLFIHKTCTFEVIEQKLAILAEAEQSFKKDILSIMADESYGEDMNESTKETFKAYSSSDLVYFVSPGYDDQSLNLFFTCLNNYESVLSKNFFRIKKSLLDYKATLITGTPPIEMRSGSPSLSLATD